MVTRVCFFIACASVVLCSFTSCGDREGCTDSTASNYDKKANNDDGSCVYNSDYFVGVWITNDSLSVNEGPYQAEPPKTLDIRPINNNPSGVKVFWKYADGSYSDTLECTTANLALSIPEQSFNDGGIIKGSIIYSNEGLRSNYEVRKMGTLYEYKGIARKP